MVTTEELKKGDINIMKGNVQHLEKDVERCEKMAIHTMMRTTEGLEKLYREKTITEQMHTEYINKIRKLSFEFSDKCVCDKKTR